MDNGKILTGLAALLYYEKPKKAEDEKDIQFESLPKEGQSIYLKQAARIMQLLSKLNVEFVEVGAAKKEAMKDADFKLHLFGLLKSNLTKMTHPKDLMKFLNDDVVMNMAHNIADGKG